MHCYSHISVLTPILEILALTRSLRIVLFFNNFCTVPYWYCLFCLCDHVDDVPFEGEQEQAYEEEFQQLAEEVKWPSPSAYSDLSH